MDSLSGKNILITGGCGTIGSQLVRQTLDKNPSVIRVLDIDEEGLFNLKRSIGADRSVRYLQGDVRDRDRVELAMENIDVVFHAAALKHVSLSEYNPFESIKTNVQGTQNVIRAAIENGVNSLVTISTDKSSNPISVMGATKLLGERLTIAANTYKGSQDTKFSCVRFGNVLGSSGSVIPIFKQQIQTGGPVTVTDPNMTRFVMPIRDAVKLVIQSHSRATGGEVFVLKMPTVQVKTIAEAMISHHAPKVGFDKNDISTEIVGTRPGERTHEKLISEDEVSSAYDVGDMYVILPQIDMPGYDSVTDSTGDSIQAAYTSDDPEPMSQDDFIELIQSSNV